ncbi:unnamed protein product [Amoebophrya sp. A120]|nr:unnamed protein product [Amoebophrya sp. A120]|eukprot:GSA120T00008100001.1
MLRTTSRVSFGRSPILGTTILFAWQYCGPSWTSPIFLCKALRLLEHPKVQSLQAKNETNLFVDTDLGEEQPQPDPRAIDGGLLLVYGPEQQDRGIKNAQRFQASTWVQETALAVALHEAEQAQNYAWYVYDGELSQAFAGWLGRALLDHLDNLEEQRKNFLPEFFPWWQDPAGHANTILEAMREDFGSGSSWLSTTSPATRRIRLQKDFNANPRDQDAVMREKQNYVASIPPVSGLPADFYPAGGSGSNLLGRGSYGSVQPLRGPQEPPLNPYGKYARKCQRMLVNLPEQHESIAASWWINFNRVWWSERMVEIFLHRFLTLREKKRTTLSTSASGAGMHCVPHLHSLTAAVFQKQQVPGENGSAENTLLEVCMIMERGQPLGNRAKKSHAGRLTKETFDPDAFTDHFRRCLADFEKLGLVHQDLNPNNVALPFLLHSDKPVARALHNYRRGVTTSVEKARLSRPLILDFGISVLVRWEASTDPKRLMNVFFNNVDLSTDLPGTAGYVDFAHFEHFRKEPHQCNKQFLAHPRTDLIGFSFTAFELLGEEDANISPFRQCLTKLEGWDTEKGMSTLEATDVELEETLRGNVCSKIEPFWRGTDRDTAAPCAEGFRVDELMGNSKAGFLGGTAFVGKLRERGSQTLTNTAMTILSPLLFADWRDRSFFISPADGAPGGLQPDDDRRIRASRKDEETIEWKNKKDQVMQELRGAIQAKVAQLQSREDAQWAREAELAVRHAEGFAARRGPVNGPRGLGRK